MENNLLKAALDYRAVGLSMIPVNHDKKPFIPWKKYQTEKADDRQLREWWQNWPDAMIGIVTGDISGILVIDVDTLEGHNLLEKLLPDTLITPIARTPSGGWHYYFKYRPGLVNKARVIEGCDVRTDGGYIVAPPSRNKKGVYLWS